MLSNVLPLHLKRTFLPIIWIFTDGEGDGIKFGQPFKVFSTLGELPCKEFMRVEGLTYYDVPKLLKKWVGLLA